MELLLNVLWALLAVSAFYAFTRQFCAPGEAGRPSRLKALLALGCVLVLLFPVVSATDDLHANQALVEDAIKRVHQYVAPLQQAKQFGNFWLFFSLLSLLLCFAVVRSGRVSTELSGVKALAGVVVPRNGRSPPSR